MKYNNNSTEIDDNKIRKLTVFDGITAVENAICEKYGLEYLNDSVELTNKEIMDLCRKIRSNKSFLLQLLIEKDD